MKVASILPWPPNKESLRLRTSCNGTWYSWVVYREQYGGGKWEGWRLYSRGCTVGNIYMYVLSDMMYTVESMVWNRIITPSVLV